MSILITGSNGFLAQHLVHHLASDYKLTLVDRNDSISPISHQFFKRDINGSTDYENCLKGIECVIHCAARVHIMEDESKEPLRDYREVNTAGTINLARQAVKSGVKRFIFLSTIKVNGEKTNKDEPFSSKSPRFPKDYYGRSKAEAEEMLETLSNETGLEIVIIRPTLVYGPGVKANFASLMKLTSRGLPLPFGCINSNLRSLVSVKNLVDLIGTCVEHPKAANEIFLVSDDCDISTSEMVNQMSIALGRSVFQLPIPQIIFKLVGQLFGRMDVVERLVGSLQVDISHTKNILEWTPPQRLEDGFRETAEDIVKNDPKDK